MAHKKNINTRALAAIRSLPVLFPALCLLLSACGRGAEYRRVSGMTWGTTYTITYRGEAALADSAVAVMRSIDMSLSPFQEGSLLSRVNRGEAVAADSMLCDVLHLSQRVCSLSHGAFDPTVAPLVNAWGFGYRKGATDVPPQSLIDSLLPSVGILDCHINEDGTVERKTPSTEFNFSAVAKGYGVDCVAAMLRRNGVNDYMVEIGGEIALSGVNSRGADWVIQIDAPVDDSSGTLHDPMEYLQLTDACIATSGNYRNYRDTSAGRVAHTISPVTGRPVYTGVLSATVIAPACAEADALATASMALGADEAMAMLEAVEGVEAMLVIADGETGTAILTTPGFKKYLPK